MSKTVAEEMGLTRVCDGFAGGSFANEQIAAHLRVSPPPDYAASPELCMSILEARTHCPMVLPAMDAKSGKLTGQWSALISIGEDTFVTAPADSSDQALQAAVHFVVVQRKSPLT